MNARQANVTLHFVLPKSSPVQGSHQRTPSYVATTTVSLRIVITPTGQASLPAMNFACAATCTASFSAPVGVDALALSLTDGSGGSGNLLSTVTTNVTVAANQANTFNLTANPVVDHAAISLGAGSTPGGTAAGVSVTLQAYDADNNLIVGPGSYVDDSGNPLTFTFTQTPTAGGGSGTLSPSRTTITDPSQNAMQVTYDGKTLVQSVLSFNTSSALSAPIAAQTLTITPTVTNEFPLPAGASAYNLVMGPDGNLWICENGRNAIAKMTPSGSITEYAVPTPGANPDSITVGSDDNLWFTEDGQSDVGRITPAGVITEFPVACCGLSGITAGADGALWVAAGGGVNRITTGGGSTNIPAGANQIGITLGADGNYWTAEYFNDKIGRLTPGGAFSEFSIPTAAAFPEGLTTGPDGNVWFTENGAANIGKITPGGVITELPLPAGGATNNIVAAPDGNLWYGDTGNNTIGRISTSGTVLETATPTAGSAPVGITVGPDATIWTLEYNTNAVARLVY